MTAIEEIMAIGPVIPVLTLRSAAEGEAIGRALLAGGVRVLEVALRTPASLDCLRAMAQMEGAVVGAGTVLDAAQLDAALEAGARFIVTPGLTEPLGAAAVARGAPLLPGIATASELMVARDLGLSAFKFFPAEAMGGIAALRALAGPFPFARFLPSGGITQANAAAWLALPQVVCVGGTWLAPSGPLDPAEITRRAKAAAALRPAPG